MEVTKISRLVCLFIILVAIIGCNNKTVREVQSYKVKSGTFSNMIVEEGEVQAVNSISISSPSISWRLGGLKINYIVEDGSEVEENDTVAIFDPTDVKKAIIEAEASLEIANAELEKKKATQESELADLEAEYEITRLSYEISKINFEQSSFEADIKKQEIKLTLDKSLISLERAKEEIDNKKLIQYEDLQQAMLKIRQQKTRLADANNSLNMLYVVAPSPGIAIIRKNWSTRNKFTIGDQPYSGYPMIDLPDLSKLKVIVNINEVDVAKIIKGLRVEIRPDAFSDSIYSGEIISIANLAMRKDDDSKIKVFPIEILIEEKTDKLMPGLTVGCQILIEEIDNVVFVPVEGLFSDGDKDYVFIKSGSGYKRREVVTANSNNDFIIIKEGVSDSEIIALADPFIDEEEDVKN